MSLAGVLEAPGALASGKRFLWIDLGKQTLVELRPRRLTCGRSKRAAVVERMHAMRTYASAERSLSRSQRQGAQPFGAPLGNSLARVGVTKGRGSDFASRCLPGQGG